MCWSTPDVRSMNSWRPPKSSRVSWYVFFVISAALGVAYDARHSLLPCANASSMRLALVLSLSSASMPSQSVTGSQTVRCEVFGSLCQRCRLVHLMTILLAACRRDTTHNQPSRQDPNAGHTGFLGPAGPWSVRQRGLVGVTWDGLRHKCYETMGRASRSTSTKRPCCTLTPGRVATRYKLSICFIEQGNVRPKEN